MSNMKRILSASVVLIGSTSLISGSLYADEQTSVSGSTVSSSESASDSGMTQTSSENITPATSPVVSGDTGSVTSTGPAYMGGNPCFDETTGKYKEGCGKPMGKFIDTPDRNHDGIVDSFEKCMAANSGSTEQCQQAKEQAKKQLWQTFGSGMYNPNAFYRGENGTIMMKDAFKMMQNMREQMKENAQTMHEQVKDMRQTVREQNKDMRQEMQQVRRSYLSAKTKMQLDTILKNIPDEKKVELYGKAIAKIDAILANVDESDKKHPLLQEIRDTIQSRLDALAGTSTEQNVLNDIFGTPGTQTSSGTTNQ